MGVIFYREYQQDKVKLEQKIFNEMKLCSFNMKCPEYTVDFKEEGSKQLYTLYNENNTLYSYYMIPNTYKYHLKIIYPLSKYQEKINQVQTQRIQHFLLTSLVVFFLTILFSLYSMHPLRTSFKLTQEFIKDILHDFNTPISSILLNIKTLVKTKENFTKINRMEQSISTILSLQDNLKSYLNHNPQTKEAFELNKLVNERVEVLQSNYPEITFKIEGENVWLTSNPSAIARILDNLLSNAAKYNQKNGHVDIVIDKKSIRISDTGKGIKNPKKIFDRFYKEHERGLGIGLHIVKKLCDELGIKIKVESEVGLGSTFLLILQ
jgi:signal transduction histidine kinase